MLSHKTLGQDPGELNQQEPNSGGGIAERLRASAAPDRAGVPHLVHVFPTFGWGGVPIRICNVMNHFAGRYRHTIISLDNDYSSRSRFVDGLSVDAIPVTEPMPKFPVNIKSHRSILGQQRPDLLLTYNWGAIEWAMANRYFPLCRHIHFESGFGPEEANRQLRRRVLFRRLALGGATRLVVPSKNLVDLATKIWRLDPRKVFYVPNGVDCEKFARQPVLGSIPGFTKNAGEFVIGTVAPLRAEKNISRLIRAVAKIANDKAIRLVIIGDGPERRNLMDLAERTGMADRILFGGHIEEVERAVGWFDIFAMSSDTEQMPNTLIQAMAAGLPVVCTDVGDVKIILSPANRSYVAPKDDERKFGEQLLRMLDSPDDRVSIGVQNMAWAREHYGQEKMFAAYGALYDG